MKLCFKLLFDFIWKFYYKQDADSPFRIWAERSVDNDDESLVACNVPIWNASETRVYMNIFESNESDPMGCRSFIM